jgi:hypothetical protein
MSEQNAITQIPQDSVTVLDGTNGANAYFYIASADDTSGTNFTYPQNPAQVYVAFLSTTSAITAPAASNFSGLWLKAIGSTGTNGAPSGYHYKFASATSNSNPGSGKLKFDNSDLTIAANIYISSKCFCMYPDNSLYF